MAVRRPPSASAAVAPSLAALGGRLAEASLGSRRDRYESEVVALIDAAHRLTRRKSFGEVTVADILEEAELSTRAFYRHFQSKDELLLAMLEYEIELVVAELEPRLAAVEGPEARFEVWLDYQTGIWSEKKRLRRAAVFHHETDRLAFVFPDRSARITARQDAPLVDLLEEGRRAGVFPLAEPEEDARSIQAIANSQLRRALAAGRVDVDVEHVRATIRRFCLPALTGRPLA